MKNNLRKAIGWLLILHILPALGLISWRLDPKEYHAHSILYPLLFGYGADAIVCLSIVTLLLAFSLLTED